MDEMKITSKFITGIVSKLVNGWLKKKEHNVKVKLNGIQITVYEEEAHIHLDVDADLSKEELDKLLKNVSL